ncbi:nucleotide-binding oligomerization domain-containing protein 2-like [Sycon ciliatum]|uniref:nucleotide-binding oligomerization domain-containing protein 2-like n=1 Tax=Sycon ciliatum TaxID=27933 RepID=UPI0031F6C590
MAEKKGFQCENAAGVDSSSLAAQCEHADAVASEDCRATQAETEACTPMIGMHPGSSPAETRQLPVAVRQFAEILRRRYRSTKVWLGKGMSTKANKRPLDKIFVNVVVIPREELASLNEQTFFGSQSDVQKLSHVFSRVADKVQHVQLANMFDFDGEELDEDESVRVLAVACAGAGKTTIFLLKGPMDWARGLIWHEFDIVSALALRDARVRNARTVVELLQLERYGIVNAVEQGEIASFVHANPQRFCITFDGLDETLLDTCSDFVRGIIRGEELKGVRLILTSRHSAEVMKLSATCQFDRRVEVLGFTRDNVREYVNNVLPCEQASTMLEQVDADPSLAAILQTPFFTESTCDVFRNCGSVPSSLFGIFTSLILSIVRQNTEIAYPDWSSIPRILKEKILELGHFAFLMLVDKKVVFIDRDLDEQQVSKESRSLGLLVACESLSYPCVSQWQFSHLSVQECLASQYIASTAPNASDVKFLVRQVGALTGHLSTFWCLLASQLAPDAKEALISAILTQPVPREEDVRKLASCKDVTHFLRSSENDLLLVSEVLCEHLDDSAVQSLAVCLLDDLLPDGVSVSQAIEEVLPHSFTSSLLDYVRALLQLWRRKAPRASIRMLCAALKSINSYASDHVLEYFQAKQRASLDSMHTSASPSSSEQEHSVMTAPLKGSLSGSSLEEMRTPVRRQLMLLACRVFGQRGSDMDNTSNDKPLPPSSSLALAFSHAGLDFNHVLLSSADCHLISSVIEAHQKSIRIVSISRCQIDDNGFKELGAVLSKCSGLEFVNLADNSISDRHVSLISKMIVVNQSTLQNLIVGWLQISSSGYAQLVPALVRCHDIRRVTLGSPHAQDIKYNTLVALVILAYCKRLYSANFRLLFGDEGFGMILPLLISRPFIGLTFMNAGLSSQSAPLVERLLTAHQLWVSHFGVSHNCLTDTFLCRVAPSLMQCTSLDVLSLVDTGLTSESLSGLAGILASCPCLRVLLLVDNDFQVQNETASTEFARAVGASKKLLVLTMPLKKFVNDRLAELLASLAAGKPQLLIQYADR